MDIIRTASRVMGASRKWVVSVRVLLVDDHPTIVRSVRDFVGCREDIEIVGEVSNGHEAIAQAASADLIVLDLGVPGPDGFEVLKSLRGRGSEVKVVIFTSFPDNANVVEAFRLGADGFVPKEATPEELLQAVRAVGKGERYVDYRVSGALTGLVCERAEETITDKDRQLLGGLARGLTNYQIAREIGYTESTIKGYMSRVYKKLGVGSRTAAVREGRRRGLILDK